MPRAGQLKLKGANPYAHCAPVQARIRQEGPRHRPRWYAYVIYAVPADQVRAGADRGAMGVDRNVGQVTDSEGAVHRMTDTALLDAKIKRKQRHLTRKPKGSRRRRRIAGQLARLHRKCKRIRANDTHHISRILADKARVVVIEDLHTQGARSKPRPTGLRRPGSIAWPVAFSSTPITMQRSTSWGDTISLWPTGRGQLRGEGRCRWAPQRPANRICKSLCTQVYNSQLRLYQRRTSSRCGIRGIRFGRDRSVRSLPEGTA